MSSTLTAAKLIKKEQEYKSCIHAQHVTTTFLADAIALDGLVEKAIFGTLEDGSAEKEDFKSFLETQRNKAKALTEKHISSTRYVDAFISAVKHVKRDIETGVHSNAPQVPQDQNGVKAESNAPPDFGDILSRQVEKQKTEDSATYLDMKDEPMMKRLREKLREKVAGDDDDDDVQFEVQNTESEAQYKCPMTGKLFEDPVRNKLCGHVYDRRGIIFQLQNKKTHCPFPGCRNQNVTMSQLEDDLEMKMKVERFKKRAERERKQRLTQDDVFDVEDNEMGDGGTTFID